MACPIFVNAQAIIHFTGGSEGYTRGCGKKLPCLVSDTKAVCCFLLISPRPCRRSLDKHNTTQFLRRSQNIQIWNDLQKSLPLAQPRNSLDRTVEPIPSLVCSRVPQKCFSFEGVTQFGMICQTRLGCATVPSIDHNILGFNCRASLLFRHSSKSYRTAAPAARQDLQHCVRRVR